MAETQEKICLTQYSHGAGCGCKISPKILDSILKSSVQMVADPRLIVGNGTRDDAAVFDLGDGTAIISTTDFFMPIVDDPEDFGRIASVNAISDVYAMGGSPLMAIAVLGWPIDKLSPEVAQQVLEGSRKACLEAGIPLAGGHSIDSPEPIFGLAVTGRVNLNHLKRNDTAKAGGLLYLTKPLGVGILTTAQKKSKLKSEHSTIARDSMAKLNKFGEAIGKMNYVTALTDVTGFGLLGHLSEICEGSGVQAEIWFEAVPKIEEAREYIALGCIPGGTNRNWDSYGHKISALSEEARVILADPQTSGGLLAVVDPDSQSLFEAECRAAGIQVKPIGKTVPAGSQASLILVKE